MARGLTSEHLAGFDSLEHCSHIILAALRQTHVRFDRLAVQSFSLSDSLRPLCESFG
jgi:hypothetical protein